MRRKIPGTDLLVAFETAARHQSFTRAAEELSLTQSAVCRKISALEDYLGVQRILGFSVVVAAIDVVIITAVATLFAFLYNLSAVVMGGLEVTLAED